MPLLSFHDVGKTYRSLQGVDYAAVEHFSVEIEVGEFFVYSTLIQSARQHLRHCAALCRSGRRTILVDHRSRRAGRTASIATSINDRGEAAGVSLRNSTTEAGFIWQDGVMTDVGSLGGTQTVAYAINNRGHVVGGSNREETPRSVHSSGRKA